MRKLFGAFALAAIAVLSSVGVGTASAATEFGDGCAATTGAAGYTVTTLTAPPGPIPLTAPTDGVITKVKIGFAPASPPPFTIPETVKVLRGAGGNNFTVTQQADVNVGAGATTADVRMPVKTGDRLGLRGKRFSFEGSEGEVTLFCGGGGIEGTLGGTTSAANPGETVEFAEIATARAPVSATIEPDADGDGYGDETQDKCPQAASTQAACPLIVLDAYAIPGKGRAVILVATDTAGAVTVSGSARLPKGTGAKKKASASATTALKSVTQAVTPGTISRFVLTFPGNLKQALEGLPKGKKLTLQINAAEANVAGQVSKDTSILKLKG